MTLRSRSTKKTMHKNRVTLRDYHSNHNRKHPLLGLQHIVECVSFEPGSKKYYLCTLCHLVFPNHMIIKHVLSFDHVHLYFKAWHPSTPFSKEAYMDSDLLACAKQAEKIHAAKNVFVQQVNLQPNDFKSVNFNSYSEALKSLESITKSCLTISVKPENKLECHPASAPSTERVKCMVQCQNCGNSFFTMYKYVNHLTTKTHRAMVQKYSVEDWTGHSYSQRGKFYVDLYPYINESLKKNKPPVGTSLVITCLSSVSEEDPFYLCFACEDSFHQSALRNHFESRKHLINTQLFQNPWQLPFAWDGDLDDNMLRRTAWKEEEQRGDRVSLKIFDIPYSEIQSLDPSSYEQVLHSFQRQYGTVFLREVPKCNTYSKFQQKEKFPLLGREFLALHNQAVAPNKVEVGCVCLLCERRLYEEETEAHIFSREHVSQFLDRFHPGSLNSYTLDANILLDLGKQAAQLHPLSNMQKIHLEQPIWEPCTYKEAKKILSNAKWRTENKNLVPSINPKQKLVPRIPPKDNNRQHETDNQKTCTVTEAKEKGLNKEEQDNVKETLLRETKVAAEKDKSRKVCPKDLKSEAETDLPVKLTIEEAMTEKPKEKVVGSHKNTEENNDALTKPEGSSSIKPEATQQQKSERKRQSAPEKSTDEASGNGSKMSPKRQRLASSESCFEGCTKISDYCTKVENADEEENRKEVMDRVLRTCVECHCGKQEPIYVCGHCLLKIPKKDIHSHVHGADHPEMSKVVVNVGEDFYRQILKPSFQSASLHEFLHKVIHNARPNRRFSSGSSQTSAQARVTPNNALAAPHSQEVEAKVGYISDECGAASDTSEKATTSKPNQRKSSHSENSHASPSPRNNKDPTDGKNNAGSSPQSTKTKCKADTSPNKTSLTIEAATKSEKLSSVPSTSPTSTFKSTAGSYRPTENASTTSKTSTPQSPTASMLPKSKSITASKETCTAAASSDAGSAATVNPEHPLGCCKTKSKDPPAPITRRRSSATSEMAKPQVKDINTEASSKTMTGQNPDTKAAAHKRKLPASLHQNPEEIKKVRKDLPHIAPIKTTPGGNPPKVGLNQLIVVSCERKQQVYCLLCSVKLNSSSQYHLTNSVHQYKYVKMKYPEWSVKELEKQLNRTVPLLAEVERNLPHSRSAQKLEVERDEYQKLGSLPDNLAIERVKALVKQRHIKASSSPTINSMEHPFHYISSPCDVSSSGIPVFHDEMSDSADGNQLQARLDQASEIECIDVEDPNVTAGQSVSEMSSDEEDLQVDDEIQDEPETFMQTQNPQQILDQWARAEDMADSETILKSAEKCCPAELHQISSGEETETHNLIQNKMNPDPIPDRKAEDVAGTLQLNRFKVQDDSQPHYKVTLLTDTLAPTVETTSKSAAHLLTAEGQHLKNNAAFQEPQRAVECVKKVSPVKVSSFGLEVAARQQNQSGLSHKAKPAPKLDTQSEERSASQANSTTLFGRKVQDSSRLSCFLMASRQDLNMVTGMEYVWECQGIPQKTFFLCEICEKTLSYQDICQHMVSLNHQLKYLRREDPRFLKMFWLEDDLPLEFKKLVLKDVVQALSKREQVNKVDAQRILLGSQLHEFVRTAPFSEALKIVKNIRDEDKQSVFHPSASADHQKSKCHQTGQQTIDPQSIQESLPTKSLLAQILEKDQRSEIAGQSQDKSYSKEASLVECCDVAEYGRTSKMDINSSSSKTDHVVFPNLIVCAQNPNPLEVKSSNSEIYLVPSSSTIGIDLSQEPCSSSLQPHYKPSVSQIEGTPSPLELNVINSKANIVVPSGPINPSQETCSGRPLLPGFKPAVSQLIQNSGSLDVKSSNSVADLVSSSPVNLYQQTCSVPSLKDKNSSIDPVDWKVVSDLISVLKRTCNQSASNISESRECVKISHSLSVLKENAIISTADLRDPQRLQINIPQDISRIRNPEPSETGISQLPINTIITPRSDHIKQTCKSQTHSVKRHHQLSCHSNPTPSPTDSVAASGGVNPYTQAAYLSSEHPGSAPTQSQFPFNTLSIHQQYFYPSQSYPQQAANPVDLHSFEYNLTAQMPLSWRNMDMQQDYSMMRRPESDQ
ncbi:uncharacterized protein FYW61_013935 isoform 2-T2 [Anableps anableps]